MTVIRKKLRDMKWDDYGISKNRYKELQAFCRQYEEKKNKIKYGVSAIQYDGLPKERCAKSQVESWAIENSVYKRDCALIEESAVKANPIIWKYIIRSVTQGLTYEFIEYDEELGRIPVGKTDFYSYRRLFYFYLHKLKSGTN